MNAKTFLTIFAVLLLLLSNLAQAGKLSQEKIIQVTLDELHPTQAAIGYDQVYYKLGRYQQDPKKQFDEICEANGQKGLAHFNKASTPNDPTSFSCKDKIASHPQDMKTMVIAPNGQYYLTDGHHTFNAFWQMPEGGAHFKINIIIAKDYRHLTNMAQFWRAMQADANVWLENSKGLPISYQQLPTKLGMKHFENDQYRSMMYFSRGVGWNKPKSPVPFLEFYWAKSLRNIINLDHYDLTTASGYRQAIRDTSQAIVNMQESNVGGSGKSPKAMGQFSSFNEKGLDKVMDAKKGKVSYMLNYKTTLANR